VKRHILTEFMNRWSGKTPGRTTDFKIHAASTGSRRASLLVAGFYLVPDPVGLR